MENSKRVMVGSIIVILAIAIVIGVSFSNRVSTDSNPSTNTNDEQATTTKIESNVSELEARVADGIYEAQQTYQYHSGTDTIDIRVKIEDGVVESVNVAPVGTVDKMSLKFITGVNNSLPSLVEGKRLDEINLPKQISGSSLTTATVKKYLDSLSS